MLAAAAAAAAAVAACRPGSLPPPDAEFPTSAELYTAIRNDPFIFKQAVTLGYADAVKDRVMYAPFNEWKTVDEGGDVPWHRVYFFMYAGLPLGGRVPLWDRVARVCRARGVHTANKELPKVAYGRLRVATLNTFNDRSRRHPQAARIAPLVAVVAELAAGADAVFLQEATEELVAALCSAAASGRFETPHVATTVGTEGLADHLVVLSRAAIVDARVEKLNRSKAFLVVDVLAEDLRPVRLLNVHLTSAMQADSAAKRAEQLLNVSRHAAGHAAIIAGDFNDREVVVSLRGFTDSLTAQPAADVEAGRFITFDAATNALAEGAPGALDKVLVNNRLAAHGMSVLRTIAVSDHYPLIAELELSDVALDGADTMAVSGGSSSRTCPTTALAIVIPFPHWAGLAAHSGPRPRPHADAATAPAAAAAAAVTVEGGDGDGGGTGSGDSGSGERWMPHITLTLGFVPDEEFFRAEAAIERIVAEHLPIVVPFTGGAAVYAHDTAATVVLEVDAAPARRLALLREELGGVVPLSHAGGHDGASWQPHLSLARCASREAAERAARRIGAAANFSFTCTKLAMVSRTRTAHMVVGNTVGAGPDCDVIDAVLAAHAREVRPLGSALAGPAASAGCDRDVAIVLRDGQQGALVRALQTCGEVLLVKSLANAHGRYLQLLTKDPALSYDVHLLTDAAPAPSGMEVLLERMGTDDRRAAFCAVYASVKAAMKAAGVYGQRYGFIPGYGVAIMVASLLQRDLLRGDDAVAAFCAAYAATPAPLRVAASGRAFPDMAARHAIIQNALPPGDNILRTVTASSVAALRAALAAGLNPAATTAARATACPHTTTLTLSTATLRDTDAATSWFGSKFLSLILALERFTTVWTDDRWHPATSSDYPFCATFRLSTANTLDGDAGRRLLQPLVADFYGMFDGAALDISHATALAPAPPH